jgi:hypothetical protein
VTIINIYTKQQSPKIYEANIDRTEKKFYNNSWRLRSTVLIMDRSSRQESNKEIEDLNSIRNQLDPTDIYKILCSKTAEDTLSSSTHGTFPGHTIC